MNPLSLDTHPPLSPQNRPFENIQSIDARIREALRPAVSEADSLKQEQFDRLAQETHATLHARLKTREDSDEVRSALCDLIALLEENLALHATLEACMNRVKKV
jgi:hypothetical protein